MNKKSIVKLYQLLIVPFAIMISFAIAITAYFTWHYSESFALDSGKHINNQTVISIETEIDYYFHHAAMSNNGLKRVINHELLDISDRQATFTYLTEILQPEISKGIVDNLHIGYPNGDYLGAENSTEGILKRVANTDTGHAFEVIQTSNNKVIKQKNNYYVQDTQWYKEAITKNNFVWSDIYPIFGTNELGMTLSEAVYDEHNRFVCVLGSDILLHEFNKHLNDIQPTSNAHLFILDSNKNIIAQSGETHYPHPSGLDNVKDSNNPLLKQAVDFFSESSPTQTISEIHELTVDGVTEKYWVSHTPYGASQGLDWHIGVIIPESDLFGHARTIEIRTFEIWLAAFIICVIIGLLITHFINYSIKHLHSRVHDVDETGTLFEHSNSPIKEVNDLSVAFSHMSHQVLELFLDLKNTNKELERIVEERTSELKIANQRLQKLVHTDNLTQLMNRRGFEEVLEQHKQELINMQICSIVCIMTDIDNFKQYNDTYGHQKGDKCLKKVAQSIAKVIPKSAHAARLGGEEFVILIPDISLAKATEVAESIIDKLEEVYIPHKSSDTAKHVSLSLGISIIEKTTDDTDDLIDAADKALYQAKHQGKNRYVINQ